jgi:hypothetical protein
MLTANYLIDILSGVIKDIRIGLEAENYLFEVINNPEMVTIDDIRCIKTFCKDLIYEGQSYRYIFSNENHYMFDIEPAKRSYVWSKSLTGVKKFSKIRTDKKDLVFSCIEGIDLYKMSKHLVSLSRIIKRGGLQSKLNEFTNIRNNSKKYELVIAPVGKSSLSLF